MADVQIAVIDPEDTQLALAAPAEAVVNVAVPGVQGPIGLTGSVAIAQDGTATEPGIRFESDSNTGIYRPGADQLAVATNGVERVEFGTSEVVFNDGGENYDFRIEGDTNANLFFVDASTDRVGIGINVPTSRLDVLTVVDGLATVGRFSNIANLSTATASAFDLQADQSISRITTLRDGTGSSATTVISNTAAGVMTERMRLDSGGRLGLGTSSPDAILDVRGQGYFRSNAKASSGLHLLVGSTDTSNPLHLSFNNVTNLGWSIQSVEQGISVRSLNLNPSGGNVGIGTTSPGEQLSIAGAASVYASLTSSGGVKNGLNASDVTGCGAVGTVTNHPLRLETNNLERARIDSSGRLLVGTSTNITDASNGVRAIQSAGSSPSIGTHRNDNTIFGSGLLITKARGTAFEVLQANDTIGLVRFDGANGTSFNIAAEIQCQVDGIPGADDMPGRLVFSTTADGAAVPTERLRITSAGVLQIADAGNIAVGTTTGTKIGTATTQKLGFYNATPVVQPTAVADATDAATVITQLNALLTRMRNLGLIAT